MGVCIPTGERNKNVNRCTNLWSMFVLIGLLLGVAGALLMALTTKEITDKQFEKVKAQITKWHSIGSGTAKYEDVVEFLDEMPPELEEQIAQSMPGGEINRGLIEQVYAEGYGCNIDFDAMSGGLDFTTMKPCDEVRRRLFQDLPMPEDMDRFDKYQKAGLAGLMVVGLVGPILTTIGMIFFCCQLKYLANDDEGKWESCCGTVMGCLVFPAVFLIGAILSILAAVFMNVMCVFLTVPFQLANIMMELRHAAVDVAQNGAPPRASLTPMFNDILPLLKGAAATAMNGGLCENDGSYLMREVLDNDPKLCKGWLMSYRFGLASQIIACIFSLFGVFITFYVGYKACCRNNRKTNIEMV